MKATENLHGEQLDRSAVALVIIDVVNDLDFPEGKQLLPAALAAVQRIAELRRRAKQCSIPVIFANDNFGRWRSDFPAQIEHCLEPESLGRPLLEHVRPGRDDYFVLKPRPSAFFGTTLEILLKHLGTKTLILTGLTGSHCVWFTAMDAYLREFKLIVPADCTASVTEEDNVSCLGHMQKTLKADTRPAGELTCEVLQQLASGFE